MKTTLLDPSQALLLVIDVQEKFMPTLFNTEALIRGCQRMIQGCTILGIPILVTEQYPTGLGETIPELKTCLKPEVPVLEKTQFGCYDDPGFLRQLQAIGRQQIMVCGLEAHVCVNQTVVRLLENHYQVHLIEDALGTRAPQNLDIAIKKLYHLGAVRSCTEMALFELMRTSQHKHFKMIQQLIL